LILTPVDLGVARGIGAGGRQHLRRDNGSVGRAMARSVTRLRRPAERELRRGSGRRYAPGVGRLGRRRSTMAAGASRVRLDLGGVDPESPRPGG
jgi:hypothetical protein